MDAMLRTDPVDRLLARLGQELRATGRARRDVLREVEGDLREAVAARVARGASEADAAEAVVAEFGDAGAVAADLSRELLADLGRRYAPASAVAAGVLIAAWVVGMTTLASLPGFRVPLEVGWMLPLSRALDVVAPMVAVAAVAGWLAIRRSGSLSALVAVAGLQLALAGVLVAGAVIMAATLPAPAGGAGILAALVALTVLLGGAMAAGAAALLVRFGAVRLAPRPARA